MLNRSLSSLYLAVRSLVRPRAKSWPQVRREHKRVEPLCQWCGGSVDVDVHHIDPVHHAPGKELDPNNLISLCMAPGLECHYMRGHRGVSWLAFDLDIRQHCEEHKR